MEYGDCFLERERKLIETGRVLYQRLESQVLTQNVMDLGRVMRREKNGITLMEGRFPADLTAPEVGFLQWAKLVQSKEVNAEDREYCQILWDCIFALDIVGNLYDANNSNNLRLAAEIIEFGGTRPSKYLRTLLDDIVTINGLLNKVGTFQPSKNTSNQRGIAENIVSSLEIKLPANPTYEI
jgi:hypothetical protein